jgi:hypothetical protein
MSAMPNSRRLPPELDGQKSTIIVGGIHESLARHPQPSSLQIYEEVTQEPQDAAQTECAPEQRPHKLRVRQAITRKRHST